MPFHFSMSLAKSGLPPESDVKASPRDLALPRPPGRIERSQFTGRLIGRHRNFTVHLIGPAI
jgi:hypothetical protein